MKQVLQRLDSGVTTVMEAPVPRAAGVFVVVQSRSSVVSAGTERMLVEFGRASLLKKVRGQPERVRQVLDKARVDGVRSTLEAVRAKLEWPLSIGYCNAGMVVEAGSKVAGFKPGHRVVTNGPHAEYVRVPHTLAARIPDTVSFEAAAFTPLAAIGLQGIRLAEPTLGETVVVFGLGLIGLLTVQLLKANGCRVIGIDRSPERLALAERFGALPVDGSHGDVAAKVLAMTGYVGADAVLLTLASSSDEPIRQAAAMSRKRGRLILVGVTGLNMVRDDLYKKELTFAVSCSYGPGRYDPTYEEEGQDYPLPFVRWTEQRNFEAVLALMESGSVDPLPLITHRFAFDDAPRAYDLISGTEPSLGVVLTYPDRGGAPPTARDRTIERPIAAPLRQGKAGIGVIGAGNFATRTLLPLLQASGARLRTIASGAGTSGAIAGEKFGFERVTTDTEALLADEAIDAVCVLTRHDTHARLAMQAMQAGKHVFVEKPLALTEEELDEVLAVARSTGRLLTVGFNRRFAPLTVELQSLLKGRAGPLSTVITVNAGFIPRDHWTQHPELGGGRIVGEACHFLDLARVLTGAQIADVSIATARTPDGRLIDDIAHMTVRFTDGSSAVVHYLSSGARDFPKERIECFFDGKTACIDNWRKLRRYGMRGPWWARSRRMDKGHAEEIRRWTDAVRGKASAPIPLDEIDEVSRWAIRAGRAARTGSAHGS